jgi:hypothetical protein
VVNYKRQFNLKCRRFLFDVSASSLRMVTQNNRSVPA